MWVSFERKEKASAEIITRIAECRRMIYLVIHSLYYHSPRYCWKVKITHSKNCCHCGPQSGAVLENDWTCRYYSPYRQKYQYSVLLSITMPAYTCRYCTLSSKFLYCPSLQWWRWTGLDVWERYGGMMLKRMWKVLVCLERMHRYRTNEQGQSRRQTGYDCHLFIFPIRDGGRGPFPSPSLCSLLLPSSPQSPYLPLASHPCILSFP